MVFKSEVAQYSQAGVVENPLHRSVRRGQAPRGSAAWMGTGKIISFRAFVFLLVKFVDILGENMAPPHILWWP